MAGKEHETPKAISSLCRRRFLAMASSSLGVASLSSGWPGWAHGSTPLPTATRIVRVANQAAFETALATALPGDHIVLADGIYFGPGSWLRSGEAGRPIVLRAAHLDGAAIVDGDFDLAGAHQILFGLHFNVMLQIGGGNQARQTKIWRCRFVGHGTPAKWMMIKTGAAEDIDIAYCEITRHAGRGISTGVANGTRRAVIRHCLFHTQPTFPANGTEAIQLGFTGKDAKLDSGIRVERCRFHRWHNDDELISVKTSGVHIKNCVAEDCTGYVNNRFGNNNTYEAIWLRRCLGMSDGGADNRFLGCRIETPAAGVPARLRGLQLPKGNLADSDFGPYDKITMSLAATRFRSRNAIVAGCASDLGYFIGFNGEPPEIGGLRTHFNYPASNIRIRESAGPLHYAEPLDNGEPAYLEIDAQPSREETLVGWARLNWLTDQDVGPRAP